MTVTVTGASGHVGANLVRMLLAQGRKVRVVVHSAKRALSGLDVEVVQGDVLDKRSLCAAFEGSEVVFHLAAMISITGDRDGRVRKVNVDGARNAAEAALECGVKRMVHVSSIHAFDSHPLDQPVDETRAWAPDDAPAYDRSKAAGQAEVLKVVERGLDAVILNPTGIIGPYDYGPSRMGRLFLDLYFRRLPGLVHGGFDFVDVRDVCEGILAAEKKGERGQWYLLSGHYLPVQKIGEITQAVTGVRPPRFMFPMALARMGVPFVELAGRAMKQEPLYTSESLLALRSNKLISHAKATEELGYQPRPTEESVRDTYEWFLEQGMIPSLERR